MTHLGFRGNWLVDTNERGSVLDFVKDFPALGWVKICERSSRSKIEMVCRILVKISKKNAKAINARVLTPFFDTYEGR